VTAGDGRAPTVTYVLRYRVGVGYSGRHAGVVTSGDGGISCPGTCAASYPRGTVVTLRATGERVDHWSGCATSSGAVCTVTAGDGNAPSGTFAAQSTPTATSTTSTSTKTTATPTKTTSTPTTSTPTTTTPTTSTPTTKAGTPTVTTTTAGPRAGTVGTVGTVGTGTSPRNGVLTPILSDPAPTIR